MNFKFAIAACIAMTSASALASYYTVPATFVPGAEKERTETATQAYAGLVWTLKEKDALIPDLTFGVRSLRVKSDDHVSGADLALRLRMAGGLAIDSVRLSYVGGQRTAMANLGVGYSLAGSSLVGILAVQASHARLGADYEFTRAKFTPFAEVLSEGSPAKVNQLVTPDSYVCPPTAYDRQGATCYLWY